LNDKTAAADLTDRKEILEMNNAHRISPSLPTELKSIQTTTTEISGAQLTVFPIAEIGGENLKWLGTPRHQKLCLGRPISPPFKPRIAMTSAST